MVRTTLIRLLGAPSTTSIPPGGRAIGALRDRTARMKGLTKMNRRLKTPPPGSGMAKVAVTQERSNVLKEAVAGVGWGVLIWSGIIAVVVVAVLVGFIFHEDSVVTREYTKFFALHPDLVPAYFTQLASFHTQSATAVCTIFLTAILVAATAFYAIIAGRSLTEARMASSASLQGAQRVMDTEARIAVALERMALAAEADSIRPGRAPQIRAGVVLNLGGSRRG